MQLGKPNRKIMAAVISRFAGKKSKQIIVGSTPGVDVSVLRIDDRAMIVSCDPVSLIPSIGTKESAVMSVYEVASDVATSGVQPTYAMIDLNLPPQLSDTTFMTYWKSFHNTCLGLGLSVVGGHSGRFQGCDYSIIGGATLWAFCDFNEYVTSAMAEDGDDLILTKSAAYGATSVLTRAFPRTVKKAIGPSLFEKAWKYFRTANTVNDSMVAAKSGIRSKGVTAMHDSTEGGVVATILEMSSASKLGAVIDPDNIPISEETRLVCKLFRIDPYVSLGEGSLLIAAKPARTGAVVGNLRSNGIEASVIGHFSSRVKGVFADGKKGMKVIHYPNRDPYWNAYWKAMRRRWR